MKLPLTYVESGGQASCMGSSSGDRTTTISVSNHALLLPSLPNECTCRAFVGPRIRRSCVREQLFPPASHITWAIPLNLAPWVYLRFLSVPHISAQVGVIRFVMVNLTMRQTFSNSEVGRKCQIFWTQNTDGPV